MKRLMAYIGKYKKYAIATPFVMIGEVLMELLIPLVMAAMIDKGISSGDVQYTVKMGLLMILMAIVSLCFGSLGSRFGAVASMGFAKNVRRALFEKVQSFSFSNVDKFSTASLVTRLTTDVNNVQNAFNMMIRMVFRAPIMMIGALIMAIKLNAKLAMVFLVAIPILCVGLYLIMTKAHPRFKAMLEKYDALNSDVQENLIAIRVVKAFVREKYESDKFDNSAEAVRATQYRADIMTNRYVYNIEALSSDKSSSYRICTIAFKAKNFTPFEMTAEDYVIANGGDFSSHIVYSTYVGDSNVIPPFSTKDVKIEVLINKDGLDDKQFDDAITSLHLRTSGTKKKIGKHISIPTIPAWFSVSDVITFDPDA